MCGWKTDDYRERLRSYPYELQRIASRNARYDARNSWDPTVPPTKINPSRQPIAEGEVYDGAEWRSYVESLPPEERQGLADNLHEQQRLRALAQSDDPLTA